MLLAAGGAVVAQSGRDDTPVVTPPASTAVDPTKVEVRYDKTTSEDLARCAVAGLESTHAILTPGGPFVLRTVSPADRVEFRTEEPNASTTVRVVTTDLPDPEWSTSTDAYASGDTTPDRPVKAEIADGAFAVLLTGPATAEPLRPQDFAVKVTDTDGHLIYQSVTR